jgi:hypothetical protein
MFNTENGIKVIYEVLSELVVEKINDQG